MKKAAPLKRKRKQRKGKWAKVKKGKKDGGDLADSTATSIATMRVSAYEPKVAHSINSNLLTMGEDLVNQLNERGRQDMIRFATTEVAQAEAKAKAAVLALAQYRNKVGVIDPERQTAIPLQQIAKLQDELLNTRSQLAQYIRALQTAWAQQDRVMATTSAHSGISICASARAPQRTIASSSAASSL
jgi:capsular polysaccharide transport system permease protein